MEFDKLRQLLEKDRSIRRFDGSREISRETLQALVELTRYCASGRNLQPLRYCLVDDPETAHMVNRHMKWAGYLEDWEGPEGDERAPALLVQCLDTALATSCLCDDGLQLQAITLGAAALGLGCCIIKSFEISRVREILEIPDRYAPRYIVAVGYPVESVEITDTDGSTDADIRYYRTPDGVHHVPKRPLTELII